MKRILFLLVLVFPAAARAAFVPNALSTGPVNGSTTAVVNANNDTLRVGFNGVGQPVTQSGSWTETAKLNDGSGNSVTSTGNALDVNVKTAGGTALDTNSGNKSAGTIRVIQATDSPAIANYGQGATGSAVPANAVQVAGTDGTNLVAPYIDPCQRGVRTRVAINQTANTQIITGASSKQTYVCEMDIVVSAAQNVALVEGTGSVCATGIGGMAGGTTAATGWNLAANGGLVKGNGGDWVYKTNTAADNVCILQSGSAQISGSISYVQF